MRLPAVVVGASGGASCVTEINASILLSGMIKGKDVGPQQWHKVEADHFGLHS